MASSKKSLKRSLSRLIAVQSLYQYHFYQGNKDINDIARQLLENYLLSDDSKPVSYLDKIDNDLFEQLISGIVLVLPKINEEIKSFLKGEWKIENLPDLFLPILQLGTFELKFMKDTPTKVVISEYVDLAACYYEEKKVSFVNRVLQNVAGKGR